MKSFITGMLLLLSFSCAVAQSLDSEVSRARLLMVRATVEFLSTDKATFGLVSKNTCSNCTTYSDIKKYAVDNKLSKVDELVDDLQKIKVDTSPGNWKVSLTNFKNAIITKITTGSDNREARKKLSAYGGFVSTLTDDINSVKASSATDNATPQSNAGQMENEKPKPTAPAKTNDTIKDAATQTMPGEVITPEASLMDKAMPWLPYIVVAVLLIALLIVWNAGKNHKANAMLFEKDRRTLSSDNERLKKERSDLEKKNKQLEEDLKNKASEYENLNKLLKAEKKRTIAQPETTEQEPLQVAAEKPVSKISVQKPKPVANILKYARYADLGDGFSNAELLDAADDETIFELMIAPNSNSGEFRVTSQRSAQHYALSNAQYFLGKTCQYNSFPSENAAINTDAPGMIKLNGNKWTIVSPAKISFS